MKRKALITGITGQDGSYLADFLLNLEYEVYGIIRRSSSLNLDRIAHLHKDPHNESNFHLIYGDLLDGSSLIKAIEVIQPDEIYNLGAQSHVKVSFEIPEYSVETICMGTLKLLEAIKITKCNARFYQASSSEMFGNSPAPQSELTPFAPISPYACAKVAAHNLVRMYRDAYGIHASCGILFNHESPRRAESFVTRKITRAATRIKAGAHNELLYLGNLSAKRDWGYAADYVKAMWLMLQQHEPGDYVIGTGECNTVKHFLMRVFEKMDLNHNTYVRIDKRYFRPNELHELRADITKAKNKLFWTPKTSMNDLIQIMIEHDMRLAKKELT